MTQDKYEVGSLENAEKFAIIRMAREAGVISSSPYLMPYENEREALERFAALVAANFQKKLDHAHQTIFAFEQKLAVRGYENQIASLEQALSEAVLAEREACAKVCDEYDMDHIVGQQLAAAIRSRCSQGLRGEK